MFIIGFPKSISNECVLTFIDYLVPYLSHPTSRSSLFRKPSPEISILLQFLQIFASDNKLSSAGVKPVPELYAWFSLFVTKHLVSHIGVDNRAHQ